MLEDWQSFQTRVPGKWVLAGEHAVLKGATAVALPHPEFFLDLKFVPRNVDSLEVLPTGAAAILQDLFQAIQDDCESRDQSFSRPKGTLEIESTIPLGAGLGSSAALCVAITRWVSSVRSVEPRSELEFARELEHRFHGQSSGMDIAVVALNEAISFVMGRGPQALGIRRLPRFTFHDTGLRARTNDCILRVEQFREDRPFQGIEMDEEMGLAARSAMEGLIRFDSGDPSGLKFIAEAMKRSTECFETWGLMPREARDLQEKLASEGALGSKLTGAGGGGFVVALWPS